SARSLPRRVREQGVADALPAFPRRGGQEPPALAVFIKLVRNEGAAVEAGGLAAGLRQEERARRMVPGQRTVVEGEVARALKQRHIVIARAKGRLVVVKALEMA